MKIVRLLLLWLVVSVAVVAAQEGADETPGSPPPSDTGTGTDPEVDPDQGTATDAVDDAPNVNLAQDTTADDNANAVEEPTTDDAVNLAQGTQQEGDDTNADGTNDTPDADIPQPAQTMVFTTDTGTGTNDGGDDTGDPGGAGDAGGAGDDGDAGEGGPTPSGNTIPTTTVVDYCATDPCQNNGHCINEGDDFRCICPYGHSGKRCQFPDPCLHEHCMFGGTCVAEDNGGFHCDCIHGRCGSRCQNDVGSCESSPCQNDGKCLPFFNKFICVCKTGFSGKRCEIGPCKSSPCQNGGECYHEGHSFSCKCRPGFTGRLCDRTDCSTVLCPAVFCENPYFGPGDCCGVCTEEPPQDKPGECPVVSYEPENSQHCTYDVDCPGHQKCCESQRGIVCIDPIIYDPSQPDCRNVRCAAPICRDPIYIPGICCRICLGHGSQCNGCERVYCQKPQCPRSQQIIVPGHCCPLCVKPDQCMFGVSGICGGFAGFQCEDPSTTQCMFIPTDIADGTGLCCNKVRDEGKIGRCPRDLKFGARKCYNKCKTDYDCPGESKCCSNGCGTVCVKPKLYCCDGQRRVNNGDSYFDGCNNCFCSNGLTACTKRYCPPDAELYS